MWAEKEGVESIKGVDKGSHDVQGKRRGMKGEEMQHRRSKEKKQHS